MLVQTQPPPPRSPFPHQTSSFTSSSASTSRHPSLKRGDSPFHPRPFSGSSRPRLLRREEPSSSPFHLSTSVFSLQGSTTFSSLVSLLHPHPPINTPISTRLQTSPLINDEASPFHRRSHSGSPLSRKEVLEELERTLSNVPEAKVESEEEEGVKKLRAETRSKMD